jgi:hypothetical protein
MQVDVETLEHESKLSQMKENVKEKSIIKERTKLLRPKKSNKPLDLKPSNYHTLKEPEREISIRSDDLECKNGFKSGLISLSCLLMKDPIKRPKLKKNLEGSPFLNEYINKRMYNGIFDNIDIDQRAVLTYSYHYLNVLLS